MSELFALPKPRLLLIVLALLLALSSTAAAQKVRVEFDGDTDFSKLVTYAWFEEKQRGENDPFAEGTPLDQSIRAAADAELAKKGMRQVALEEADVLVAYHGMVIDSLLGGRSSLPAPGELTSVENSLTGPAQKEGTLMLVMVDPESREHLWTGIASITGKGEGITSVGQKKAEKLARKIAKKYPPK